ncbi:MAG: natural resistance-associated macrophage protein [Ilumatobacteraceae bacterium]|nr:natural resistance-associated macrophage protein [Ilumatobacteraceae bacterium]
MKKVLGVALGVLTAIGGFVDMGDLVANAETGARFDMNLAWVVVFGVIGIMVYAEMSGRVAALCSRPVFDLVRERLGARFGMANLLASFFINFLTLTAELGGVALSISLVSSVNYILIIPLVAILVWLVCWRMPFEMMERVFGLLGLCLLVFAVTVWKIGPDWNALLSASAHPHVPGAANGFSYAYFCIAVFGAAMTPYEVFFFSSGGVEDGWTKQDLGENKINVFIGFPLGALLSLAIMACAHLVLAPRHISVEQLSQVALPVASVMGRIGLALVIVGIFAATFGAALETALSAGYVVGQYFGWPWGKRVSPRRAARFHVVVLFAIAASALFGLTGVDPVKVTEYSIVLSAAALPLTYFPILVIANDPRYMGPDHTNGRFANGIASVYLVVLVVVAVATIPLMIITKGGS